MDGHPPSRPPLISARLGISIPTGQSCCGPLGRLTPAIPQPPIRHAEHARRLAPRADGSEPRVVRPVSQLHSAGRPIILPRRPPIAVPVDVPKAEQLQALIYLQRTCSTKVTMVRCSEPSRRGSALLHRVCGVLPGGVKASTPSAAMSSILAYQAARPDQFSSPQHRRREHRAHIGTAMTRSRTAQLYKKAPAGHACLVPSSHVSLSLW